VSIFKKEKKEETLQEVEQAFSELQFAVGQYYYLAHIKSEEANQYQDKANEATVQMQRLAQKGLALRKRIESEVKETIEKGQKVESPLN
jgi:hypothetical protein